MISKNDIAAAEHQSLENLDRQEREEGAEEKEVNCAILQAMHSNNLLLPFGTSIGPLVVPIDKELADKLWSTVKPTVGTRPTYLDVARFCRQVLHERCDAEMSQCQQPLPL